MSLLGNIRADNFITNQGFMTGNLDMGSSSINNVEQLNPVPGETLVIDGNLEVTGEIIGVTMGSGWSGNAETDLDMNCYRILNITEINPKPGDTLVIDGNLEVTGNIIGVTGGGGGVVSIFRRDRTMTQTISDNTSTRVEFDTNDANSSSPPGSWDAGMHEFTVNGSGWYSINTGVAYDDDIDNKFRVDILVDGTVEAGQMQYTTTGSTALCTATLKVYIPLNGVVRIETSQFTGSNKDLQSAFFIIQRVAGEQDIPVWVGTATSDLNMDCFDIVNVGNIFVGNIYGKSPVTVNDVMIFKNGANVEGQLTLTEYTGNTFTNPIFNSSGTFIQDYNSSLIYPTNNGFSVFSQGDSVRSTLRKIGMLHWGERIVSFPSSPPQTTSTIGTGTLFGQGMCFDGINFIYVSNGSSISKVTRENIVVNTFPIGSSGRGMCFDGSCIWVANGGTNNVTKFTPNGTIIGSFNGGGAVNNPYGIAFDISTNTIWICNNGDNNVVVLNADTGSLVTTVSTGNNNMSCATDGKNYMWVTQYRFVAPISQPNTVTRILLKPPYTATNIGVGSLPSFSGYDGPYGIAFDGDRMWISGAAGAGSPSVYPINVTTDAVGSLISVFTTPLAVCFDGRFIYCSCLNGGGTARISVIDTKQLAFASSIDTGFPDAENMCFDGEHIWIKDCSAGTSLKRIGPVTTNY